jgi:hypothetical protein
MGFEVERFKNLVSIGSFWFKVFGVEATSIFNVVGRKGPTIFIDFANHECRNPSFGLATKAKGIARVRAKRKPGS